MPYLFHFLVNVPQCSKNQLQVVHHSLDLISHHLPAPVHGRSAVLLWAQEPSVLWVCSGLPGAAKSCRAAEASPRGEDNAIEGQAEALHRGFPQVSLALGLPACLLDGAEAGGEGALVLRQSLMVRTDPAG